jgi:hypothetical protein
MQAWKWAEMAQELKVIQDFYDFMLWVIQHTESREKGSGTFSGPPRRPTKERGTADQYACGAPIAGKGS